MDNHLECLPESFKIFFRWFYKIIVNTDQLSINLRREQFEHKKVNILKNINGRYFDGSKTTVHKMS